ncbi:unnamed protein product [Prorocentrum cordatum]|uniref:Uncharacterized protein n=1 Tax=Prorocentrum cordatum TaxID=2364126 RepID=A0ABN9XGD9_9DINO|nr:unnamed protein product [Polarella glacialis]
MPLPRLLRLRASSPLAAGAGPRAARRRCCPQPRSSQRSAQVSHRRCCSALRAQTLTALGMADLSASFSEVDTVVSLCCPWSARMQLDAHRFGSGSTTASCNGGSLPLSDFSEAVGGDPAEKCCGPLAEASSARGRVAPEAAAGVVQGRRGRVAQRRALVFGRPKAQPGSAGAWSEHLCGLWSTRGKTNKKKKKKTSAASAAATAGSAGRRARRPRLLAAAKRSGRGGWAARCARASSTTRALAEGQGTEWGASERRGDT